MSGIGCQANARNRAFQHLIPDTQNPFGLYTGGDCADNSTDYMYRGFIAAMRNNNNAGGYCHEPAWKAISSKSDSRRFHIAVLDDEPMIRELLHDNLCEQGHRVSCFATPQELLATLWRQRFDVILSDVKMPTMNGLEFYERLAEQYPMQARRILFLTGDVSGAQIRGFLERTGCPYLAKPFRQTALLAGINELAQRTEYEEIDCEYGDALPKGVQA